jgi:hypothetical protein
MVAIEQEASEVFSSALKAPCFPQERARAVERIVEINDMFEMSLRTEFLAVCLYVFLFSFSSSFFAPAFVLLFFTCSRGV